MCWELRTRLTQRSATACYLDESSEVLAGILRPGNADSGGS